MRRLSRLLLNLLTGVSLVLLVAVAVVWVRGHFVSDRFFRYRVEEDAAGARTVSETWFGGRGVVAYGRSSMSGAAEDLHAQLRNMNRRAPGGAMPWHVTTPPTYPYFQTAAFERGFKYDRRGGTMPGRARQEWSRLHLAVPLWAVALPLAALPAVWGWRWHRRRRRRASAAARLCPRCGYDVRATPGRCPECGTVAADATHTPALEPKEQCV